MKASKEMVVAADRSVIAKHVENIFTNKELYRISVCANFAHTAADGKRYNTQFRQWATRMLCEFVIKGYVLDKNGWKTAHFWARAILNAC